VGTKPEDIPDELVSASLTAVVERCDGSIPARRMIAGSIDWLRKNPAELARLLGWEYFRSPTGRDALRVRL
jgi:hypothetical protein